MARGAGSGAGLPNSASVRVRSRPENGCSLSTPISDSSVGARSIWLTVECDAARLRVGAENHAGNVELAHRHQLIAIHARVVIGDDHHQRVRPVRAGARDLEKFAERMIGVLDRIVHGLFRLLVQLDAPVRKFERRVIGGGEHQHEERLAGCVQGADALMRLVEQILVRNAPAADELRRGEVVAIDDGVKAVAEEEAAHVVEMRFAAVDEFVAIAGAIAAPTPASRNRVVTCRSLTTLNAGVGGKPATTASMPRTERVPVAYSCSNQMP